MLKPVLHYPLGQQSPRCRIRKMRNKNSIKYSYYK